MPREDHSPPEAVGYAGLSGRGLLLMMWYGAAIIVTVLTLGAHQFQLKVLSEDGRAAAGIPATLTRVVDMHTRYRVALDDCLARQPERVARLTERHRAYERAEAELIKANTDRLEATDVENTAFDNLVAEIKLSAPPPPDGKSWSVAELIAEGKRRNLSTQALFDAAAANNRAQRTGLVANQRFEYAKDALNRLSKEYAETSCDAVTDKIFSAGGSDAQQMRGFVLELDAFSKLRPLLVFFGDPVWFVKVPTSILTLLLTLAMGALGSTIFVTVQFLAPLRVSRVAERPGESGVPPLPWFIFRPFLGMIVALAVYVAFRAGQITLSATPGGGDTGLNPFVVSFFALIAGLLSERAIEYLVRSGEKLLGGSGEVAKPEADRRGAMFLGTGLAAAFTTDTSKTRENLASHMKVTVETVGAWIEERERVSRADAEKIATWLGGPVTQFFTAVEPPAGG